MFSEKLSSWKNVIIGFAGFGFVLSFILGIIGGVLIGAVILRAFIFAVVFAGISVLMLKLIETFIPELLSSESDFDKEDDSSVIIEESGLEDRTSENISGKKLDITIEDEDDASFSPEGGGVEELETVEVVENTDADGINDAAQPVSAAEVPDAESDSSAELVSEVEEVESVEELEKAEPAANAEAAAAPAAGNTGELPDIGDFADGFEAATGAVESNGLSSIDGTGSGQAEILGGMHDTDEIVKAVKTVLKKDQEG